LSEEHTARWTVVLGGVGLLWLGVRRTKLALWLLFAPLSYFVFSQSFFTNPIYNLRTQQPALPFFLLLGAAAVAMLVEGLRRWPRAALALAAALCALPVGDLVVRAGYVTALYDQQEEWRFLQTAVPKLPAEGTLLVTEPGYGVAQFSNILLRRNDKALTVLSARLAASSGRWPPVQRLYYYQSTWCFIAFGGKPPTKMQEPCAAVWERYRLRPLLTTSLDVDNYSHLPSMPRPLEIGFFEVVGENDGRADPAAPQTVAPTNASFPPPPYGLHRGWVAAGSLFGLLFALLLWRRGRPSPS
jgi:hypothetical protein